MPSLSPSLVIITLNSILALCFVNMLGINTGTIVVSLLWLLFTGIIAYDTRKLVKCGHSTWAWIRTVLLIIIEIYIVVWLVYSLRVDKNQIIV